VAEIKVMTDADQFARDTVGLLQLGDHVKWPHTVVAVLAARFRTYASHVMAAQATPKEQAIKIVIEEINSSTGPTGGWLDSPKAVCAEIVARLEGAEPRSVTGLAAQAPAPTTLKCMKCGLSETDLVHHPEELSKRGRERGIDVSDFDCHAFQPNEGAQI
jgi:hypothetical protein